MKKLTVILLCLAIILGLTCCANGVPDESGDKEEQAEVQEDPREEEPAEEAEVPQGDLVIDAHTYKYSGKDEFDQDVDLDYRIPKIDLDTEEAKKINAEIEDIFFNPEKGMTYIGFILTDRKPMNADVGCVEISYRWFVNQDVLSLVIRCVGLYDNNEYFVYNLDVKNDTRLANADMIVLAGLTETEFHKTAKDVLGSKYWEQFGIDADTVAPDESSRKFFNTQLTNTISDDNISNGKLYLNEKGQLCIIAQIYSLAGADYYWHDLNTVDYVSLPYKPLEIKKAEEAPAPAADWKKAYIDFINDNRLGMDGSFGYESFGFYLIDIDGDDIPELYIDYLTTAGGSELATYANGEVVSQYLTIDSLSFIKGKNIFREAGGRMGTYFDTIYTIKNGKFVTVAEGSYMEKNGDPNDVEYTWSGAPVTEEEYNTFMNAVFDTGSAAWAMDTTRYDNQSIISAINNY